MAMSSNSQSNFHPSGSIASSSANQTDCGSWADFSRIVANQFMMQGANCSLDTYRNYLQQNQPSESTSMFQQGVSEFETTCPLQEPIFDPGSSNPMRELTSSEQDKHNDWSNSNRDNWIEMLDAIPKNVIDTYKSYLHREPSENNFRFLSSDESGSRRFIDESRFQLDEAVDIREPRSVSQDNFIDWTDNHGTEDMEIEDIEEVEMQDVFSSHRPNIHQQVEILEDTGTRTNAEPQPHCLTDDSRSQSDGTQSDTGSLVDPFRDKDIDFDDMDTFAMLKVFPGHALDAYEPMEQSEDGAIFPRIITFAPTCLECEKFVSMAGLLPDAPPEDIPLDSDMDASVAPESQAWFFLPSVDHMQQSVNVSESQANDDAVRSDISSDNEDYDTFPQCDLSPDADIMQPDGFNVEPLEDMLANDESEIQAEFLLSEELPAFNPETPPMIEACGVESEISGAADMCNVKTEIVSVEKMPVPSKPGMLSPELKAEILLNDKVSNLKQEMSAESLPDMKQEMVPHYKMSNIKPKGVLNLEKLSSVKQESDFKREADFKPESNFKPKSDFKPELLTTQQPFNIKSEMPLMEASSGGEKRPSSEELAYIKSETHTKRKPAKELPYLCTECGQRYLVSDQLEQHLWDHIAEMNGKHPFTCLKCPGRRFLNMKLHEQHHRMGLECDVCGQAFHAAIVIAEHKMRVHSVSKIKCKICRKSFSSSSELSRHKKRRHLKTKPYKCKVCDKSFEDKDALAVHSRCHTSEKESKTSKQSSTIKEDSLVRKSSASQQFTCCHCEESFLTKHEADNHMKSSHIINVDQNHSSVSKDNSCPSHINSKPLESGSESASLSGKQMLKDHSVIQKEHRHHKCKECSYSSSSSSSLSKHVRKHHKDKIYECLTCDRWYFKKDDLRSHTEKHHKSKEKHHTASLDPADEKEKAKQ